MKDVKGQTEIDSMKICVVGRDKNSIFVTKYYGGNFLKKHKLKMNFKKNECGYYKISDANFVYRDKSIQKKAEQKYNLFFNDKGYWTSGWEYVYNKDLNLIRINAKIDGPKLIN